MEFSILIPVYNASVNALAEALRQQAEALSPHFQILFIDDCSELSISYLNQKVALLPNVEYQVLTENIGRSAIRNLLFQEAKYDLCIVLDGDVSIIQDDFIKAYLSVLKDDNIVVGGHVYQDNPPKDPAKYLHWYYGSRVESRPAHERQARAYASFMSANFACSKNTFQNLGFNEKIKGYGHEDTLFGIQARQMGIAILHINNPVRHDGIDTASVFLEKQQRAIYNLKQLYQQDKLKVDLRKHVRLIKVANIKIIAFLFSFFKLAIHKNLMGKKPSLILLQMQKVIWWQEK